MEIKKNDIFVCIKTVKMKGDKEVVYRKGYLYESEEYTCITNDLGKTTRFRSKSDKMKKHFLKIKHEKNLHEM